MPSQDALCQNDLVVHQWLIKSRNVAPMDWSSDPPWIHGASLTRHRLRLGSTMTCEESRHAGRLVA
jgi:hypothetical protein